MPACLERGIRPDVRIGDVEKTNHQSWRKSLAHLENTLDSDIIWKRRDTYCHPCMLSRISKDLDEHV